MKKFTGVKMNKWILRGSFSQSSKRFDKETRNTQCTAMAALALAYTKIVPIHEWTTETIDEVHFIVESELTLNLHNLCFVLLDNHRR